MKNSLETKLGFFVALTMLAAVLIVETLGNFNWFRGGYHVVGMFNTVQDLKEGNEVKMAGVEIGKVVSIQLTGQKARVVMKINNGEVVKTDSTATIKFMGLMGQNYVSISFGSAQAPQASDGTVLESVEQPDLNAIMAKLNNAATGIENFGRSFSGEKLNNLLGPLIDFVKQNGGHLGGSISNIENITAQIASGKGTVGKLIYDQSLYNSAMGTVSNLQATIASARQVVTGVRNGKGTLGRLATDPGLYIQAASAMTNLNQILIKINQGQGTVGKLVNDQEFYKNAQLSLQKLDKAADGLEDQGPLSVLGIVVGNLF
ncbi:MAG: MCE family protein [Verrucomicrobiota bacterium]|nr:MCE family protein [Verrucomicrobiota bacterium]